MMIRKLQSPQTFAKAQSGAVLAVSLLILVVLTIIGVASVNGSIMELFMASNTQSQIKALKNAENSLAEAQTEVIGKGEILTIVGGRLDCDTAPDGTYSTANAQCDSTGEFIDPAALNWDTDANDSIADNSGNTDNRYIIESLGLAGFTEECSIDPESIDCTTKFWIYRITTRSTDARGTVRMVQSIWNNRIN